MKIIGYARLSSKEQAVGITLDQQIDRLKQGGAEEILYDLESGSTIKRKSLAILIEMASKGEVKKIICTRIDRLSRKTSDGLSLISNLFDNYKVNFEFLDTPQLNISDANGKFILTVFLGLAEHEASMFKQRSKNGRDYRKANNFPNSNPPFGYLVENKERYVLNSTKFLCLLESKKECSKADIARDIIEEFIKVKSSRKVMESIHVKYGIPKRFYGSRCKIKNQQRELSLVHEMSLNNWLRNPVLRGHTAYSKINQREKNSSYINTEDWDIRENTHPNDRLLSEVEWILLQSIITSKSANKGGKYPETKRYFVGLTYCANCGAKATTRVSTSKNRHEYYFCRNFSCNKEAIRHDALSQEVVKAIFEKALNYESSFAKDKKEDSETMSTLKKRIQRTIEALRDDPTDIHLVKMKKGYEDEMQQLLISYSSTNNMFEQLPEEIIKHPAMKDIGFIYTLDSYYRKVIYQKLIKSIILDGSAIHSINFNF